MKAHPPLELCEPVIVPLVSAVIVQDHVNLLVCRLLCHHALQKVLELCPLLEVGDRGRNLAGSDFQGGEQT